MRKVCITLLLALTCAWPAFAGVEVMSPPDASGSQMTTSPSGFVGVMGPNGQSPPAQHRPYIPPEPACPSCAPAGQSQSPTAQPPQH